MSTPIPGVTYVRSRLNPAEWLAPNRPSLLSERDSLVLGTYIPGPGTTGVLPGTNLTTREANSSGYVTLSTPNQTIRDTEFWGTVQFNAPGIRLENCALRGKNPNLITSTSECLRSYGENNYHGVLVDCTIDPLPWQEERGIPLKAILGVHGGNVELYRCEITNVEDAWSHLGHSVMAGESSVRSHFSVLEQSWCHRMFFTNGPSVTQSGRRTHSDVFQIQSGKNITIRGNMLGGARDMTGYRTWPDGYNSGDDAFNAALQVAQGVDASDDALVENVIFDRNWVAGGTSGVNHSYSSARPNTFATMSVTNNRFFTRGTGWGTAANESGGYDSGNGFYITRSASLAAEYSGNVNHETGLPVTITNG